MKAPRFEPAKFAELILHLARRSEEDPNFGIVKLNKLLYYADFNAYHRLGRSITGAQYRKLTEGPAPAEMPAARKIMLDAGDIVMETKHHFNSVVRRTKALREARPGILDPEELAIADEAAEAMRSMTERQAADLSKEEIGWKAARHGEVIPYPTAWLSPDPLPQDAEEWFRKQVS